MSTLIEICLWVGTICLSCLAVVGWAVFRAPIREDFDEAEEGARMAWWGGEHAGCEPGAIEGE